MMGFSRFGFGNDVPPFGGIKPAGGSMQYPSDVPFGNPGAKAPFWGQPLAPMPSDVPPFGGVKPVGGFGNFTPPSGIASSPWSQQHYQGMPQVQFSPQMLADIRQRRAGIRAQPGWQPGQFQAGIPRMAKVLMA